MYHGPCPGLVNLRQAPDFWALGFLPGQKWQFLPWQLQQRRCCLLSHPKSCCIIKNAGASGCKRCEILLKRNNYFFREIGKINSPETRWTRSHTSSLSKKVPLSPAMVYFWVLRLRRHYFPPNLVEKKATFPLSANCCLWSRWSGLLDHPQDSLWSTPCELNKYFWMKTSVVLYS